MAARILTSIVAALLVAVCLPSSLPAQYKQTADVPELWKTGFDSIDEADSEELVAKLAGDDFSGRGTGQEGYEKAAKFVAEKLEEYGFEAIDKDGDYFQGLPFARIGADLENSWLKIGDQNWKGEQQLGFVSFTAPQTLTKKIVFVSAKGDKLNIGKKERYEDKIVVLNSEGVGVTYLRPLIQAKPAAIIQIVDGDLENRTRVVRGGKLGRGGRLRIQVTREVAREMAKACGVEEKVVMPREEDGTALSESDNELTIDLKIHDQPIFVPNVVGWFEGSDPKLKDEYIVIGAHLDHLGENGGKLFPGADDNASGSSAILQIAKALHMNPTRPKRSVLYIAFAAEEIGLVGSRHYVDNPLKPLDKCVCMLNIDMVGRNEEHDDEKASENETSIHLVHARDKAPKLHETVLEANKFVGFDFEYDEERVDGRSDHSSFAKKEIPAAFVFGGFNPHYHQTSDTIDGINFSKVANTARLYYASIFLASEHGSYK